MLMRLFAAILSAAAIASVHSSTFLRFPVTSRSPGESQKSYQNLYDAVLGRAKALRKEAVAELSVQSNPTESKNEHLVPSSAFAVLGGFASALDAHVDIHPTAARHSQVSTKAVTAGSVQYLQVYVHNNRDCSQDVIVYGSFGTNICLPITTSSSDGAQSLMLVYDLASLLLLQNLYADTQCTTILLERTVTDLTGVTLGTCEEGIKVDVTTTFDPPSSHGELSW
jgi:hypothetical protein